MTETNLENGVIQTSCAICGAEVSLASDAPADEQERPLCITHWLEENTDLSDGAE